MIYTIQLLPNIWWIYSPTVGDILDSEDKQSIIQFTQYNQIKQSINIDTHLGFWNKSAQFIVDIKKQVELHEHQQLMAFLNKITALILNNYNSNKSTLILSSKYNEIGLAIWVFFFNKYGDVGFEPAIQSLNMKMPIQIPIPENLRRFFLLNLS
jgi:hypothetical protein